MDLFEYQGKQYFARLRHRRLARRRRRHGRAGRRGRRTHRLSRRRQGPGQGRRSRQGRRRETRQRRRRGAAARRQHPRAGHQRSRRAPTVDRALERHRQGVLRLLHAGSPEQGAPGHAERPGRRRDRSGRRGEPRRDRLPLDRPGARSRPRDRAALGRTTPNSTRSRANRPPNCWSTSTTATPRATATSPRSTR